MNKIRPLKTNLSHQKRNFISIIIDDRILKFRFRTRPLMNLIVRIIEKCICVNHFFKCRFELCIAIRIIYLSDQISKPMVVKNENMFLFIAKNSTPINYHFLVHSHKYIETYGPFPSLRSLSNDFSIILLFEHMVTAGKSTLYTGKLVSIIVVTVGWSRYLIYIGHNR